MHYGTMIHVLDLTFTLRTPPAAAPRAGRLPSGPMRLRSGSGRFFVIRLDDVRPLEFHAGKFSNSGATGTACWGYFRSCFCYM